MISTTSRPRPDEPVQQVVQGVHARRPSLRRPRHRAGAVAAAQAVSAARRTATARSGRSGPSSSKRTAKHCAGAGAAERSCARPCPATRRAGGRCSDDQRGRRWRRSPSFQSSSAEMPLAASVITSRCCSGVIGSPSTSGAQRPGPGRRRTGGVEAAGGEPPLQRPVVGDLVGEEGGVSGAAVLRPAPAGCGRPARGVGAAPSGARPHPPRGQPHQRALVAGGEHGLDQLDPPAGPEEPTAARPGRPGPARGCRRPAGPSARPRSRSPARPRAAAGRRAGRRAETGVPGADGQRGGPEAVVGGHVQGSGQVHARSLVARPGIHAPGLRRPPRSLGSVVEAVPATDPVAGGGARDDPGPGARARRRLAGDHRAAAGGRPASLRADRRRGRALRGRRPPAGAAAAGRRASCRSSPSPTRCRSASPGRPWSACARGGTPAWSPTRSPSSTRSTTS